MGPPAGDNVTPVRLARPRPRPPRRRCVRARTQVLGEPGIGKSVLVRRTAAGAELQGGCVSPKSGRREVEARFGCSPTGCCHSPQKPACTRRPTASSAPCSTGSGSISVLQVSVGLRPAEGNQPHVALRQLLIELGRAAAAADRVVLLHVDTVQNTTAAHELSQLLVALGDAVACEELVPVPVGGSRRCCRRRLRGGAARARRARFVACRWSRSRDASRPRCSHPCTTPTCCSRCARSSARTSPGLATSP
jgi:hypothetical protein